MGKGRQLKTAWAWRNKVKSPLNLFHLVRTEAPSRIGMTRPLINWYWGTTWTVNSYTASTSDRLGGISSFAY